MSTKVKIQTIQVINPKDIRTNIKDKKGPKVNVTE